jgi:zinc protease
MSRRPLAPRRPRAWLALAALAATVACASRPAGAVPVTLPAATHVTLKSGLRVIVLPTHRVPLVDFRLVAAAGSVNDPAGHEGVASLTADLMTQGAGPRNARQLAEDIAFVGGTLDAEVGPEQLVVTCEVLPKDFAIGLDLFRDVIAAPTFPPEEFARKKDEALGAIASSKDDASEVAERALLPYLFGTNSFGHPVSGWEKSVTALGRDDVVAFHRRFVSPDNAILAVVGDVDPREVVAALEKAFADWKPSGEKRPSAATMPEKASGLHVRIVDKPDVTQTQIRMATLGVGRSHPDYFPIQVANTILGAGFTSRLVNEIRVQQGLSYSIASEFAMYRSAGTFEVTTFTKNETLRKTIDETLRVMRKLIAEGPTDEEVAKARRYLTGLYPLGLQAPADVAAALVNVEFYGLPSDFIAQYDARVNAVTPDDVRRALRSYFDVDNLKILVVSNPATAKTALDGLAPVEVTEIP